MKAAVWTGINQIEIQEVPVPEPGPGEVLVKVRSAGVCRTDLEVVAGKFNYGRPPHILGHEIAGEVAALGKGAARRRVGERVVVETSIGCGECPECRRGDRHLCGRMEEIGSAPHQGGYAQYVKAPEGNLVLIPENVSFDEAGIVESVVCPVGGLMRFGVRFGETVLVYGVGPAGAAFIQGAKAMGAGKVIAVARNRERLERAGKMGADLLICSETENVLQALGWDKYLMIDVGMKWTDVKGAIKAAKAMEEYGVHWIEEPFSPDSLDAYARLAASTSIHIAGGEEVGTIHEYLQLLDKNCVDIVRPDLSRCGGLTVGRKLADICERRHVTVVPHAFKTHLLMAATLQFTASLPNAWYLEFCEQDTVLRRELTSTLFEVDSDGFVSIPQTPGFGIELDWDALERYRVDG